MRVLAVLMLAVVFATLMYVISLTFFDVTINYKIESLPSIPVKPPQHVETSSDSQKTLKHASTLQQRVEQMSTLIVTSTPTPLRELPGPTKTSEYACRKIQYANLDIETSNDVYILSGSHHIKTNYDDRTQFVLYVPDGFATPPNTTISRLRSVLFANPTVDVVGANTIRDNVITQHCHHIELCHWTLLLHFEYSCSVGPFKQCDSTSPIFMTRKRHAALLQQMSGPLAPLTFFVTLKQRGAMVLTDTSVVIDEGSTPIRTTSVTQKLEFVRLHAVDEIRNRDTSDVISLCTNSTCDGNIIKSVLRGNSWESIGITMPIFAYRAYITAFQSAVRFLNSNNVTFYVDFGGALGIFKLGRLLPWDAGDVDIVVDSEQFNCSQWMLMLKTWADKLSYIYPHTHPAGQTCDHYGVYAMPRLQYDGKKTYVNDPWSIGLVTFTRKRVKQRLSTIRVHGVDARIVSEQWSYLKAYYQDDLLEHKTHANIAHRCDVLPHQKHNCLINTISTHLDTCMEYTQFGLL